MNGATHWRWPLLASTLALIMTGVAAMSVGPLGESPLAVALAAALVYVPVAVFLPACWRVDKRVLTWFSFLLLFYFCGFIIQAVNPAPVRYWGIASSTLVAVLFVITVFALRSRAGSDD